MGLAVSPCGARVVALTLRRFGVWDAGDGRLLRVVHATGEPHATLWVSEGGTRVVSRACRALRWVRSGASPPGWCERMGGGQGSGGQQRPLARGAACGGIIQSTHRSRYKAEALTTMLYMWVAMRSPYRGAFFTFTEFVCMSFFVAAPRFMSCCLFDAGICPCMPQGALSLRSELGPTDSLHILSASELGHFGRHRRLRPPPLS